MLELLCFGCLQYLPPETVLSGKYSGYPQHFQSGFCGPVAQIPNWAIQMIQEDIHAAQEDSIQTAP